METAGDPFETAGPAGEDDPFADAPADPAAEVAAEPVAEGAPPAEEPPIVDREGAPAAPPQEAPAQPEEPAEAPAPAETPAAPAQAPVPPAEVDEERQPPAEPGADASAAQEGAQPAADSNGNGAAQPERAKGEMRHYKVLYQTADKQWAEYPLTGDLPEGVNVATVEGEAWVEARNNDHATRIAFAILGSPQDGVTVWPVPRGAYKPKRVRPAAPKPERTALEISS